MLGHQATAMLSLQWCATRVAVDDNVVHYDCYRCVGASTTSTLLFKMLLDDERTDNNVCTSTTEYEYTAYWLPRTKLGNKNEDTAL